MRRCFKTVVLILSCSLIFGAIPAYAAEAPASESSELAEKYAIPAEYTKVKIFDGTYGFGDAQIIAAMNDDESRFYIQFECFGDAQILEGTAVNGICNVSYDLSGFVSSDCQAIYDDALASGEVWQSLTAETAEAPASENSELAEKYAIPAEYTKVKIFDGTYGFGDAQIIAAMNDDESRFYIQFECFGDAQILEGTAVNGICNVSYDLSGFVSSDCQAIYDDALASGEDWQNIGVSAAPEVSVDEQTQSNVITGRNYLKDANLVWLGADYIIANGEEVADYIAEAENGQYVIYANDEATIAGDSENSYVTLADNLKEHNQEVLIVELTDNDLAGDYAYGRVDYSYDENDYDTNTILGALNYVFKIARDNEMPSVVLLTESENEEYKTLTQKVYELQEKWGFGVLDTKKADEDKDFYVLKGINDYLVEIDGDYQKMFQYAGNLDKYDPSYYGPDRSSSLQGLNIIQLGSSVTEGFAADNVSFVEYISVQNANTYVKEAASGTCICNYGAGSDRSYIERMKANIDPDINADLFICQLSTNDVKRGAPLGEISDSDNPEDYDLETVAGAIEYIIHYVEDTWNCPIMFYTVTDFRDETYGQMVDLLISMKDKYDIGVIDMYHNLSTDVEQYRQYMADEIHPTKRGYVEWWTPYMVQCIKQYLQPDKSEFDFEGFEDIITEGVLDETLSFTKLPIGYNDYIPEHRGTSFILHYTTDAYEDGKTYDKFCRVYLPYGYDPEDTETKYNVLYFQHGNGNSPNTLLEAVYNSDKETPANGINLINNLLDPDNQIMDRFIIICPTYYFETPEGETMTADASGPAGDGNYEGIKGNYYKEVVEDLIPQIESQFNVYCEDFSPEGIKASRDHRAWAGYSRGSMCTWYMFHNDFEYFKWWLPMSADIKVNMSDFEEETKEETAFMYLKEAIDAHPDLDFFIFATSGNADDATSMRTTMKYLSEQTDVFSYGTDPEVNNFYYTCSDFSHNMLYAPYTLYNARNILFKGN